MQSFFYFFLIHIFMQSLSNSNNSINKHFYIETKNSTLQLHLKKPNQKFLQTLAKLKFIKCPSLDPSFSTIHFLGYSILTLPQFIEKIYLEKGTNRLSYNTIIQLINCINKQQKILEKNGLGFFSLAFEDIVVVDEWNFFCANPNLIAPLTDTAIFSKKIFVFNSPIERNRFSSPELLRLNKLPSSVSLKTFYYSLASLAFFCFFRKHYTNDPEINFLFESILYTKLYWFLKRALEHDVNKRSMIFI